MTQAASVSIATGPTVMLVGTSFKPNQVDAIESHGIERGFFEVHAENYMGAGGPPHRILEKLREWYPVSVHGVCMSIGGPTALDRCHLIRFADVLRRYQPLLVSEHLAWSSHEGTFFNDLLPLPYTEATLTHVCNHIDEVQTLIGRPILIENPATYVTFSASTMEEVEFIRLMAARTGCGLLLDINNVFVSAVNHGYSAELYLDDFPLDRVGEIHLAGHRQHSDDQGQWLLIDSHDCAIDPAVWNLYRRAIRQLDSIPTLIEWDKDLPEWSVLRTEALRARHMAESSLTSDEALHAA